MSRSGSVVRRRRVLATEHVIGWNFSATWFQRRAGLTTLVATTAGGSQSVPVLDVPEDQAVRVAEQALPDLVRAVPRGPLGSRHVLQGAGGQPRRDRHPGVPGRLRARRAHGRGVPARGPQLAAPAEGRRGVRDRRARATRCAPTSTSRRSSRSRRRPAPTRSTPATASCPRTRTWPRPARRRASRSSARRPTCWS